MKLRLLLQNKIVLHIRTNHIKYLAIHIYSHLSTSFPTCISRRFLYLTAFIRMSRSRLRSRRNLCGGGERDKETESPIFPLTFSRYPSLAPITSATRAKYFTSNKLHLLIFGQNYIRDLLFVRSLLRNKVKCYLFYWTRTWRFKERRILERFYQH